MVRSPPILFANAELSDWLRMRKDKALDLVQSTDKATFLGTSEDDLADHVVATFEVAPLELHDDQAVHDVQESTVDARDYPNSYATFGDRRVSVPAHTLTIKVPYSGQPELWELKPNFFTSNPPCGTITADHLLLVTTFRTGHQPDLKAYLQRALQSIQEYLRHQKALIDRYNQELPNDVKNAISKRQGVLAEHESIGKALGIPLERKDGTPDFRRIPIERASKPLPSRTSQKDEPEPALSPEQYEDILSIIRHMGRTFESTPHAIQTLGEEALRDVVLGALNAVYRGMATGETFRKQGKTDICIEAEDRSAFVGECKLWDGKAYLLAGLEQLLSYLTWRDGKTALIVFNLQAANRAKILTETETALKTHPSFKREKPQSADGEYRFVCVSSADGSREVECHVFVFHLYVPQSKSTSGAAKPVSKKKAVKKRTRSPKKQATTKLKS